MTADILRLHPESDRDRFMRLTDHIRINGNRIAFMPDAVTPAAKALKETKEQPK